MGAPEGLVEGADVGPRVGEVLGLPVGDKVVGLPEGLSEGTDVGLYVGNALGLPVGD